MCDAADTGFSKSAFPSSSVAAASLALQLGLLAGAASVRADCGVFVSRFESGTTCAWSAAPGSADACAPAEVTVEEVQSGARVGSPISLSGVVVTALSKDAKHLFVSDASTASPCTGVYLYRGGAATVLGGEFVPGALIDAGGTPTELDLSPGGDTFTQLSDANVSFGSSGGVPTPLTGVGVGTLASLDEGEPYEGVLVRTGFLQVTATTTGDRLTLTSESMFTIVADDDLFDYSAASYPVGTCFSSVTGIMSVNTFDNERRLLPRSAEDLAGTSCP